MPYYHFQISEPEETDSTQIIDKLKASHMAGIKIFFGMQPPDHGFTKIVRWQTGEFNPQIKTKKYFPNLSFNTSNSCLFWIL